MPVPAGYDLDTPMAQKTGEYRAGIGRLLAAPAPWPELVAPYLELVRATNPPASCAPIRARRRWRGPCCGRTTGWSWSSCTAPTTVCWPAASAGRRACGSRTRTDSRPWWRGCRRPSAVRVVLIDPSYEIKSDYDAVPRALARAHRRFATGTFLLWYPVIERARAEALLAALCATGIPAQFRLELALRPDAPGLGMTGCGLVVINPPWTLPDAAATGLPWLAAALGATGPCRLAEWLTPPAHSTGTP